MNKEEMEKKAEEFLEQAKNSLEKSEVALSEVDRTDFLFEVVNDSDIAMTYYSLLEEGSEDSILQVKMMSKYKKARNLHDIAFHRLFPKELAKFDDVFRT